MILITGATGFLGKNLTPILAKYDKLRILVRRTSDLEFYKDKSNIEIYYGDIEKDIGIADALKNIDIVIHGAARTMGNNYQEYYQTNVLGTFNLVKTMQSKGVKQLLHLSSLAACGPGRNKTPLTELDKPHPISLYGRTKQEAENIIMKSALNYIILRPVTVFGPHDIDVLRYVKFIVKGISPVTGCGTKYLSVIYIEDLVSAIVKTILSSKFNNRIYFVSDGQQYKLQDILKTIADLLQIHTRQVCIPGPIAMIYGLINDVFLPSQKKVVWRDKIRELKQKYWLCSCERIRHDLAFQAKFTLEQALEKTLKWYKNQGFLT